MQQLLRNKESRDHIENVRREGDVVTMETPLSILQNALGQDSIKGLMHIFLHIGAQEKKPQFKRQLNYK